MFQIYDFDIVSNLTTNMFLFRKSAKRQRKASNIYMDFRKYPFSPVHSFTNCLQKIMWLKIISSKLCLIINSKDSKYGFGGKKRAQKRNTSESAADVSTFRSAKHSKTPKKVEIVYLFINIWLGMLCTCDKL